MLKAAADDKSDETTVKKEEILDKARSAYEAVVAIAKEARRLNAAPGVYLKGGDKPIHRAVRNFVDGKVEYEIDEDVPAGGKTTGRGKKRR